MVPGAEQQHRRAENGEDRTTCLRHGTGDSSVRMGLCGLTDRHARDRLRMVAREIGTNGGPSIGRLAKQTLRRPLGGSRALVPARLLLTAFVCIGCVSIGRAGRFADADGWPLLFRA
jgi:hypothetical protein